MKAMRWELPLIAALATILGLVTGRWLVPADDHDAHDAAGTAPAGDHAHEDGVVHLDPGGAESLGLQTEKLARRTFVRTQGIAAQVEDLASTRRDVHAPLGGVVVSVEVAPGRIARPGEPLLRVQREALPPPALSITHEFVYPSHDEIHAALGLLRNADAAIAAVRDELARLTAIDATSEDAPLVPRQRRIELGYELRRQEATALHARHELERHGFASEQIGALLDDRDTRLYDAAHAIRALQHGNLWPAAAPRVVAALPEPLAALPLAVGAIAELGAHGVSLEALAAWLAAEPDRARGFMTIASLLLDGRSIADVRRLADAGALDEIIVVTAPPIGTSAGSTDWDVAALHARPGQPVRAGEALVTLRDPRRLRLRVDPVGSEFAILQASFASGSACTAKALVAGSGPDLADLRLTALVPAEQAALDRPGVVAWAELANQAIERDGARAWALQPGMRYQLLVPTTSLDAVWVVPREAIVERGGARIVFLDEGGGHYHPQPVVVLAEDGTHAAIRGPENAPSELADGIAVVVRGAYALALAAGGAAEAGHHDHDH